MAGAAAEPVKVAVVHTAAYVAPFAAGRRALARCPDVFCWDPLRGFGWVSVGPCRPAGDGDGVRGRVRRRSPRRPATATPVEESVPDRPGPALWGAGRAGGPLNILIETSGLRFRGRRCQDLGGVSGGDGSHSGSVGVSHADLARLISSNMRLYSFWAFALRPYSVSDSYRAISEDSIWYMSSR